MSLFGHKLAVWFHGLLAVVVSSAANSLSAVIVDPNDFNPFVGGSWMKLAAFALTGALIGLIGYLKQSPLPPPE